MCLPVNPYKIEREWKAFGLSCAVVMGWMHRCGYVRVPPSHPAFGKTYDELDVSVHGGLTFSEIEPCTEHEDGQGYWVGFDCGHAGDAITNPEKQNFDFLESMMRGHRWTQKEVEAECERLAEQLAGMK